MLGPVDLIDWDFDERELLSASIRLLSVVRRLRDERGSADQILGSQLAARLRAFNGGRQLSALELRRILGDLQSVDQLTRSEP